MRRSNKYQENYSKIDRLKEYSIDDAINILDNYKKTKLDETVEMAVNLGVDPKHADQVVRGTVALPNGTGRDVKVLVIAKGDNVLLAEKAGADYSGSDELIAKIKSGWTDIDVIISTPDMMSEVSRLGKILGPRGLMPSPKSGTVTADVVKAVKEIKAGKIEFRVDKNGIIHVGIGKMSFDNDKIVENAKTFIQAIINARPSSLKGIYLKKISISSTMSPGIRVDQLSMSNNLGK